MCPQIGLLNFMVLGGSQQRALSGVAFNVLGLMFRYLPGCLHCAECVMYGRSACWTLWCLGAVSSRRCLAWSLTS